MLDLHFTPTPNGRKITIFLHELDIPYEMKRVDLGKGDQFTPEFLAISPNNRMPAIVDHDTDPPITLFESGAILTYLADKYGKFLPTSGEARYRVFEWLYWQVGGLGPMAGQLSHFVNYAPDDQKNGYGHTRYANEFDRLLGVMNRVLENREFLAGDYSIADMASFPWVVPYKRFGGTMEHLPHLKRWFDAMKARPAVVSGCEVGSDWRREGPVSDEARAMLFGQTSKTVAAPPKRT